MSRLQTLSDAEWGLIEDFMPSSDGRRGRRFSDHRLVVEGIIYRYRTGIAWRDLPAEFGAWQTVWKRHRRFAGDGTWDKVLTVCAVEGSRLRSLNRGTSRRTGNGVVRVAGARH